MKDVETLYCDRCNEYKSVTAIEIEKFRGKPFLLEVCLSFGHKQLYDLRGKK